MTPDPRTPDEMPLAAERQAIAHFEWLCSEWEHEFTDQLQAENAMYLSFLRDAVDLIEHQQERLRKADALAEAVEDFFSKPDCLRAWAISVEQAGNLGPLSYVKDALAAYQEEQQDSEGRER